MEIVYEVWYRRTYDEREDSELHIGIYATEQDARTAIGLVSNKPGFRESPGDFEVNVVPLNATSWTEGFKTVFGPSPKDAAAEAFDIPYWVSTSDL